MSEHGLPLSSLKLRPMHMRGLTNCINAGMYDLDEIARACGLYEAEDFDGALTKVHKMNLAKNKKKVEEPKKKKTKKTKSED